MNKGICSLLFLLISLIVLLSGCVTEKLIVQGTGTIVYNQIEGGFYGIISDEPIHIARYQTVNLDPLNLPDEFKEDGLRVQYTVRLRPGTLSYHMWGITVDILEIEKI